MAQVVRFWPKILRLDPSDYQVEKWHRSLIKWKSNWAGPAWCSSSTRYQVHTKARVATDALDYEYNHDTRTQSPRLAAARLQLAVGRRGLGPREQGEQRTQRVSFVATSCESTQSSSSRAGLGCFVGKNTTWSASARLFGARLESVSLGLDAWVQGRAKCTRRGVRRSSSRHWLEYSESKNLTAESHEQKNEWPEHHLRTRSLFRFCTNDIYFCDQTKIWSSESDPHNKRP